MCVFFSPRSYSSSCAGTRSSPSFQRRRRANRSLTCSFNKRPEDFPSSADYNDYLESYESLTFSLIHSIGSDLTATEAKIRAYELENRRSIEENEERGAEEREELERRERGEREWRERERKMVVDEIESERKEKEDERRKVMEMLVRFPFSPSPIFRPRLRIILFLPSFPHHRLSFLFSRSHRLRSMVLTVPLHRSHRKRATSTPPPSSPPRPPAPAPQGSSVPPPAAPPPPPTLHPPPPPPRSIPPSPSYNSSRPSPARPPQPLPPPHSSPPSTHWRTSRSTTRATRCIPSYRCRRTQGTWERL